MPMPAGGVAKSVELSTLIVRAGVRIPSVLTNTLSYRNELSIGLTKRRLDRSGPPGEIRGKNQKKKYFEREGEIKDGRTALCFSM